MITAIDTHSVVVFDLDDTLYPEEDFLLSGYAEIAAYLKNLTGEDFLEQMLAWRAKGSVDVFEALLKQDSLQTLVSLDTLLRLYRFHEPTIELAPETSALLNQLKQADIPVALITDGRSVTQRNKLKALGIESIFEPIIISEEIGSSKPAEENYRAIEEHWPGKSYLYIADNTAKDFLTPNKRGWRSVCLIDKGRNIHPQSFDLPSEYLPEVKIATLGDLIAPISRA